MKYDTIVFLVETPILTRYYTRYGIESLRNQGFSTTILDLSPYLLPAAFMTITSDLCDYNVCGFDRIHTLDAFKNKMKSFDPENTLIICSMGYQWEYRKLFREIKRSGFRFCYFMQEISPTDNKKMTQDILTKLSVKKIMHAVTRRIPHQFQGVPFASFIIGCGENPEAISVYKNARLCKKNCPIYYFHSSNYEECLTLANEPIINGDYCVFIDQYLPYHHELISEERYINPDIYYRKMNLFFNTIEKELSIKVVIAAHPRSNYSEHPNYFEGRTIIKNGTCNLVKFSKFVIYHFSNSLSYVTVFKKPVLVVSTEEIDKYFNHSINQVCNVLNTTPISVEAFLNADNQKEILDSKLKIDYRQYESYVKNYMKKDYNGVLCGDMLWKQIGDFLKQFR